jgi:DNA repair protein RadC
MTRNIIQSLALLEIRVPDHFIISTRDDLSFAEQGLM